MSKQKIHIDPQAAISGMRGRTPISSIWPIIRDVGYRHWAFDVFDRRKAFIMACFSEVAYLSLTDIELAGNDRYKVFTPSLTCQFLRQNRISLRITEILAEIADIRIQIFSTEEYVYIFADVGPFSVVAVRGTRMKSLVDWCIDLDAMKNHARNGFHHRGFDDEATIALPLLAPVLENSDRPLYFTGHSLGGAVASILARRWPDQKRVRQPYVFASPRFGTKAAARRLSRYHFTRSGDFVPHVPPRFYGFSDEGAELYVLPDDARHLSGIRSLFASLRKGFAQHSIEGHRALLGAAISNEFAPQVYIDIIRNLTR